MSFKDKISALGAAIMEKMPGKNDGAGSAHSRSFQGYVGGSNKKIIVYAVALSAAVFITSMLTTNVISSYYQKRETEEQIATMESFLQEWHEKNNELNGQNMRAVMPEQVDKVQTDIIFRLQAFKVNINSIKEIKQQEQQEKSGRVYSVDFSGPYEAVMRSIKVLQESDALIGFRHLVLTARDGAVSARLTYKIYTK